jgi:hypothetical protein
MIHLLLYKHDGTPLGYLKSFDPNAHAPGRPYPTGDATYTARIEDALAFDDVGAALEFYRQPSVAVPVRPDGAVNRPLTVFHAEIVKRKTS